MAGRGCSVEGFNRRTIVSTILIGEERIATQKRLDNIREISSQLNSI
jgi:hypothetical protein